MTYSLIELNRAQDTAEDEACEMDTAYFEYDSLVRDAVGIEGELLISYWLEQLPFHCRDEYLTSTLRPTEILRFRHGSFEYVLDQYDNRSVIGGA